MSKCRVFQVRKTPYSDSFHTINKIESSKLVFKDDKATILKNYTEVTRKSAFVKMKPLTGSFQ